jgi:membrane associated rhomboid family serine protease
MLLAFPIGSDHERERFPAVTLGLIGFNTAVFAVCWALGPAGAEETYRRFGYTVASPGPVQVLAHLFLHGSLLHLAGNMVFLWAFGADLEDALGWKRYLSLYLLAGLAAVLSHDVFVRLFQDAAAAKEPAIGASGAISGLIGFHVLRFHRFRLHVYYIIFLIVFLKQGMGWVSSILFVALWFLVQLAASITSTRAAYVEVAYWAHAGGFLLGLGLALATRQLKRGAGERWLSLGRERFRAGRWWPALKAFQELARIEPASALPLAEQARCWEVIGRQESAQELFRGAIRLLLAQGDAAGACDLYLEFVTAFPDTRAPVDGEAELRALVAECERRGKTKQAASLYEALMTR